MSAKAEEKNKAEETLVYTKFEKARMIGSRALQLAMGAPFLLKLNDDDLQKIKYDCIEIAIMEYNENVLPITVKRPVGKAVVA